MATTYLASLMLALAAGPGLERFAFTEPHMGTAFQAIVYAPDRSAAERAARAAFARIAELDGIMSDYRPASELMRLCARAGGEPVQVSDDLFVVLSRADEVSRRSGGAFDVTVGPVTRLWRRARRTHQLPEPDQLKKALALVGYDKVKLDEKAHTVRLTTPGMLLDLGGIAKGYTADEALKVLKKHGIDRALVAAGGDIAVSGPPPGAEGWRVVIVPLTDAEKDVPRTLILHDMAVSTSGDAEQYLEIDGVRYSHLIDPRTGLGLTGRRNVTVVALAGILSDSLTKVVSVLGPAKGFEVLKAYEGVSARVVVQTDKGLETTSTKDFPKLHANEK